MVTERTVYDCNACGDTFNTKADAGNHVESLLSPSDFLYRVGDRRWVGTRFVQSKVIQPENPLPYADVEIIGKSVNSWHENVYEIRFETPLDRILYKTGDTFSASEDDIIEKEPASFVLVNKSGKYIPIEDY
jgi:hypothetical protein